MLRQIKLLARVQLANLFGINEARFSRDTKQRWSRIAMVCLMGLLVLMLCFYVGMMAYGLIQIGAGNVVPTLLAMVAGLVVLVFTLLRAGPTLFDLHSYEMLIALPLKPAAIVISRFLTMHVSNAGMSLAVFLPAMLVCGALQQPQFSFYPMMLLGALLLPLVPMTISMLLGALIYTAAARMRCRNLAVLLFSMLGMLAIVGASAALGAMGNMSDILIFDIVGSVVHIIGRTYPPALWFGHAVEHGDWLSFLSFAVASVGVFLLATWLVGRHFQKICTALRGHSAAQHFSMKAQEMHTAFYALLRRELRRYFACPIYVMNTMVGGLMTLLMAAAALFFRDEIQMVKFMLGENMMLRFVPFAASLMFVICPTTSCTISLEGKNLWLLQSLPLNGKAIMNGKLALSLIINLPFWLISEILLVFALCPTGMQLLWLILVPLACILLSAVLGLAVNLCMPMLNWENENQPVKQSKAVAIAMLAGFIALLFPTAAVYFLPTAANVVTASFILLAVLLSLALYRWCCAFRLNGIGK